MEGQEEVAGEEEVVVRQRQMRGEAGVVGEVQREGMRGPVEGVAGVGRGWEEAAVEQICLAVMEGEAGVQRRELWRGEEVEVHLVPVREVVVGEGRSRDVGVGEEGRLWMEVEVEVLKKRRRRKKLKQKLVIEPFVVHTVSPTGYFSFLFSTYNFNEGQRKIWTISKDFKESQSRSARQVLLRKAMQLQS